MKTVIRVMMMLAVVLLAASCTQSYSPNKIKHLAGKLAKSGELSDQEWDRAVGMLKYACNKSGDVLKGIAENEANDPEKAKKLAADFNGNYPEWKTLCNMFTNAPEAVKANVEPLDKEYNLGIYAAPEPEPEPEPAPVYNDEAAKAFADLYNNKETKEIADEAWTEAVVNYALVVAAVNAAENDSVKAVLNAQEGKVALEGAFKAANAAKKDKKLPEAVKAQLDTLGFQWK